MQKLNIKRYVEITLTECADMFYKIVSLQCSWVRRLFSYNIHQWKLIHLFLIQKYYVKPLNSVQI